MMYQAIRRCWRYGQTKPVNVWIITSESEGAVRINIARKEKQAQEIFKKLTIFTKEMMQQEITNVERVSEKYNPNTIMEVPDWLIAA